MSIGRRGALVGGYRPRISQKGETMVGTLIAIAILGIVGTAFMAALANAYLSRGIVQEQATAEELARKQLEQAQTLVYQPAPYYYPAVAAPTGYAVTAQALPLSDLDGNIQKIKVAVSKQGRTLLVVEDYKVNR